VLFPFICNSRQKITVYGANAEVNLVMRDILTGF